MNHQNRVMAVHDISCFGRCSLTVALPILSAAGIETSVIPTAVLSTHTGGFRGYTFRDLTGDIPGIACHWKSLGLRFDGIYTGYLGSYEQLTMVSSLFDTFGGSGLICVDPVMADNGVLYPAFRPDFPQGMRQLCKKADVIVPNLTEAALLLNEPYREGPYTEAYIQDTLKKLAAIGPRRVVLTGVYFDAEKLGCASYDRETGEFGRALTRRIEGCYHGTGDVFASALIGALMKGFSLPEASRIAADFTVESIARTRAAGTDVRFGVDFEEEIPAYVRALGLNART